MSGLFNTSLNGSTSSLPDSSVRSFSSSFPAQSVSGSAAFHQTGNIQGLQNIHRNFNVPNLPVGLGARSSTMNNMPSSGVQQGSGNFSSVGFASNNLPVALSQISHGSSHVMANRSGMSAIGNQGISSGVGGSIPGFLQTSATVANRNAVPGLSVSPSLGNPGPRITSSVANIVGSGNIGRNISSGGGLSASGSIASRLNLTANNSSGNLNLQGQNRMLSGMLQQASPQVLSMLSSSYPNAGGSLSQSHLQAVNSFPSMGMLNDVNPNDGVPFDMIDFPQLTSRPNSSGGPQGQLGSLRKQSANSIVQQNQEFSMQNEDFPALGSKVGSNDYSLDPHQKDQLHDSSVSMMQPQHFSMGRSASFNIGSTFPSHRPQQQQQHAPSPSGGSGPFLNVNNQDYLHLHNPDIFPSSHSNYQSPSTGPPIGMRPLNSSGSFSSMDSYDQALQQFQQHQSQFRLQQLSSSSSSVGQQFRGMKSAQQPSPDSFNLRGLLNIMRTGDNDSMILTQGIDLTTLGLNMSSNESVHKTFASPWSEEPAKGDPEFTVPPCYYSKQPQPLSQAFFSKFPLETIFYVFYSMPKDEAQLYAGNELYNRGWLYHREQRFWFMRVPNVEPLVKTNTYERGSYIIFDPNSWDTIRKDNFVVHYEVLEKRPTLTRPDSVP